MNCFIVLKGVLGIIHVIGLKINVLFVLIDNRILVVSLDIHL